jgi:hypothetical protein
MTMELERFVEWFRDQCDGDWEHGHAIRLVTLDNPGWSLDVSLEGTSISGKTAPPTMVERTEHDWVFYETKNDFFRGRCGPGNLVEMLGLFLQFAEESEP